MQQRATHLHLGHHQPQVLHGAHTAGAAVADKASRLVGPLVEDKVDRILQAAANAVADYRERSDCASVKKMP